MKNKNRKFNLFFCLIYFAMVLLNSFPAGSLKKSTMITSSTASATSADVSVEEETSSLPNTYYYDELSTTAKRIYRVLADMRDDGSLKSGTATVDLIELGVFANSYYDQDSLTAEFGAAIDAFSLDNAGLFWVDFDKMSIRVLENGSNYQITLGIGRYDNYFADGFSANNVDAAIAAYETAVQTIVEEINTTATYYSKVQQAYKAVIDAAEYALEYGYNLELEEAYNVRNAYGILVLSKGCCEGFARAFKVILDELGISSVLVQGVFLDYAADGTYTPQAHMWNYVMMDDNRWYIADPTMDNALDDGDSCAYFVKNNIDKITLTDEETGEEIATKTIAELYEANGIISSSNYEFTYPVLTSAEYAEHASGFTFEIAGEDDDFAGFVKISYNGMGLKANKDQGIYIIFTFETNKSNPTWFYMARYIEYSYYGSRNEIIDAYNSKYDTDEYFYAISLGDNDYIMATTNVEPTDTSSILITNIEYCTYSGETIPSASQSVVYLGATSMTNPYAVSVSPDSIRFYVGSSYSVTIIYSEDLMLSDTSKSASLSLESAALAYGEATDFYSNFVWNSTEPNKITFTFTPSKNYGADRCFYYFSVDNLVGVTSKLAPSATGLYAMNKPTWSCPANPLSYCTAYASQPMLIADSDLSTENWELANGDTVNSSISAKLSLVATKYSESEAEIYESEIESETNLEILSSATYDLSLNLCDVQVNSLNGETVKILVPFPEGYTSESTGVEFKAYHFADDGSVEEISCVVCEYGLILMCSSFSPYTICAVDETSISSSSQTKSVLVITEGDGAVSSSNIGGLNFYEELSADGSVTFTFTPNIGSCIDKISVNGNYITVSDYESQSLTLNYDDIDDDTIIIVHYASKYVVDTETARGFSLALSAPVTANDNYITYIVIGLIVAVVVLLAVSSVVKNKNQNAEDGSTKQ